MKTLSLLRHRPAGTGRPRARGFTLLEVLVAIVVLSFGVLGVVGLQAAALRATKESRYISTATALSRELADMMRGNKDIALLTTAAANPYLGAYLPTDALPTAAQDCFSATCTTSLNVAAFNMRDWIQRVRTALPGARIAVCFDDSPYDGSGLPQWACTSAANGIAVVKIGWTRQSIGAANALEEGATSRPIVVLPLIAGSTS